MTKGRKATTKGRKTTKEERLEIVRYYLDHNTTYQKTAEIYQVSYHQVYSWVKKYKELGEKGLLDRRGKTKEEAQLTEADRLRIENRKLKKANEDLRVENLLIKKLRELEDRYR